MKRIQTLRVANHIILALSIIGYFSLWQDSQSQELALFNEYIKSTIIASLVFSIFFWFFILTFCDNAEDSKEILTLLKGKNIQKTEKQQQTKNKKTVDENEIIDIEGMKQTVSPNELIVKVKGSGKIEKITKEDWEEIVKMGNKDKFEIKYNKN